MQKIQTIAVPIDFLKHTDPLVEFAVFMANKLGAKIKFFHVVELYDRYAGYALPSLQQTEKEMLDHARERMDNLVADHQKKVTGCEGEVVNSGDIAEAIISYTKDNADLIIISTHGRKGFEKILLGSVAEQVLKNSTCPVLIHRPDAE